MTDKPLPHLTLTELATRIARNGDDAEAWGEIRKWQEDVATLSVAASLGLKRADFELRRHASGDAMTPTNHRCVMFQGHRHFVGVSYWRHDYARALVEVTRFKTAGLIDEGEYDCLGELILRNAYADWCFDKAEQEFDSEERQPANWWQRLYDNFFKHEVK